MVHFEHEASDWVLETLASDPLPHTLEALRQKFVEGVDVDMGTSRAHMAYALTELTGAGLVEYVHMELRRDVAGSPGYRGSKAAYRLTEKLRPASEYQLPEED